MALAVAGCSGAVSSLSSLRTSPSQQKLVDSSSSSVSGIGRRGVGARLAVERRGGFLGSFSCGELLPGSKFQAVDGKQRGGVRCFGGPRGRGRVVFIPVGPRDGSGPWREWERRERGRRERIRNKLETEIRAPWECEMEKDADGAWGKFSLLRELGKRLRAVEEAAGEKTEKDSGPVQEGTKAEKDVKEGAKSSSEASTYELMKELEKRLREETESEKDGERGSTERRGRRFRAGGEASLYDFMRGLTDEMREQRSWLEEQWKPRDREGRTEKTEREKKDEKRGQAKEELGGRNGEEKKTEDDETSKDSTDPTYPQSDGTVVYLKNEANGAEIFLVGTSHVSQKSVAEVREVIQRVKPDFVMVELCRKRYDNMKLGDGQGRRNPMAFVEQMIQMLTNGSIGGMGKFVGIGLASFYKLLSYRGFHPGKEIQVAVEEARKVGAKIVLGDQDIETTLKRMGNFNLRVSMQDAFRFFGKRMPSDIAESFTGDMSDEERFEKMRDRKIVRRFNEEMKQGAPAAYKALVTERNETMVKALRNLKGKVVAVVGLAHMDGMEQLWHEANTK